MTETLKRIKESPLSAWIKYNLIGGGIGLVCGILLTLFVMEPIKYSLRPDWLYDYHLEPLLSGLFFWLPFSLCIGIAQLWKLKQWKIQTNGWIFATVFGWSLLGIIYAYTDDYFVRQSSPSLWQIYITETAILLIGGMCVGMFQSIATRKTLPKSGLWIVTNMLGILALVELTWGLMALPFAVKSYILEFFYAHDLYALVEARDLLLLSFLILSVPFVATLTLFMPTGKILLKYGVPLSEKEDRVNSKTNGESSQSKTG